jgi:protein SCO1
MSHTAQRTVATLAVIAIIAAAAYFLGARPDAEASRPQHATVLPERLPLPEFSLLDQDNAPFTREDLRGKTSLVFFGFTHCPDICPATLQQLAVARKSIAERAGEGGVPEIILISVDPERDTPAALREYVSHFGEGVTGVTGEPEDLRKLTAALGIYHEKSNGDGGDYTVNHSTAVLVVDDSARLQAMFSAPHSPDYFVRDVPLLMASR